MNNISICVSFIAAILGIAYPILLGVVSRLDEKYSSQAIIELFRSEWENRLFIATLKISLWSILLWTLKLPPLIKIRWLDSLIGKSALLLSMISTIVLIVSFFYFVRKVLIYYTPTKFLPYLIQRHISVNQI